MAVKPKPVSAKTKNQRDYIISISQNDVTFCSGPAGSGKSMIAAGIAAEKYYMGWKNRDEYQDGDEDDRIKQIIITRPLVCVGKDIGALPGELGEKIAPYFAPMEEYLKYFFGATYQKLLERKIIRYEPLETMRGMTYHNAVMILDEGENCTLEQIKMFLTRMGHHSKAIINGDLHQTDLKKSGLEICMSRLRNLSCVGVVEMDFSDIQRNSVIGQILKALDYEQGLHYNKGREEDK